MQEKLYKLFKECKSELKSIGINLENKTLIGDIDISISKRSKKDMLVVNKKNLMKVQNMLLKEKSIFQDIKNII